MKKKNNWFDRINIVFMLLLSCSILFPFWILISQSLMTKQEIALTGYSLIPQKITFAAYEYLLKTNTFLLNGFQISLFVVVVGTALCLFFTSTYAYALSKKYLPYRKVFTLIAFFTMLFSGGLIPTYMLIVGLKLINSVWALILPSLISPWYLFIMRNFFMGIPDEVEESAVIDGANDVMIWARIILPLSMPAIATIGLFYAVAYWNSWVEASIYISDSGKWPLQMILRQLINSALLKDQAGASELTEQKLTDSASIQSAAVMIASVPIMLVYPFIQKYFVKGVMVGSIKG